ncbi:PEP-CTERM sorting domain-containing protein [Duganella fentianensis]|uniref:PEP-CTERM sorting domain-containing protein n=1 Tax=Duganella fentianensis TaxID=2692177 RepID=UPI0032B1C82D
MRAATIFKSVAVIAALVAGQAHAAPTELVTNGSFEATTISNGSWSVFGSLPGWSSIGSGIELRNNVAGSAYDGSNFVELDSYSNSAIEQSIATAAGKHYTLNFAIQDRAGVALSSQGVEVFWNGVSQGVFSNATNWTVQSLDLTASGATSTLRFAAAGTNDSLGTSLDKISLVAAPVPEPETYGMLLAGLALVGAVARRKARKA